MSVNKTSFIKQAKTKKSADFAGSTVPDFIQKLFRMLENDSSENTLSWGPDGTTFIVKDTIEFSRTVLPKHFKHSNFASFVRQLNKYDFHKVRQLEEGQKTLGDQAWEFVHPKFVRHRKDLLEEIKRKVPGANTIKQPKKGEKENEDMNMSTMEEIQAMTEKLISEMNELQTSRTTLENDISRLSQRDQEIMNELSRLNANLAAKDGLVKEFLGLMESSQGNVNISQQETQKWMNSYHKISKTNAEQIEQMNKELGLKSEALMNDEQHRHQHRTIKRIKMEETAPLPSPPQPIPINNGFDNSSLSEAAAAAAAASMNAGSLIGSPLKTADGLTFVTLGRLSSNMSVRDNKPAIEIMAADQTPTLATSLQRPTIGMKRKPSSGLSSSSPVSWTVPPRILLVDDDSVYRDLSEKLLQVFGCTIDLAKDGVEALKKMGLEKYDLILMDIVMPRMDGVSATRSIRQYDALTPIISMTSNFTDNDIMQYIGSGMTDILPKPFSKRTLYQMLDKYCAHLKSIQRVQVTSDNTTSIPRALNILPMGDTDSIASSSTSPTTNQHSSTASYPFKPSSSATTPTVTSNTPSTTATTTTTTTTTATTTATTATAAAAATSTPTVFPLAPYPYPITMNSVPTDVSSNISPIGHNDIPNVTLWPQQPNQHLDTPPAIIANDGKFTWAMPTARNNNNSSNQRN